MIKMLILLVPLFLLGSCETAPPALQQTAPPALQLGAQTSEVPHYPDPKQPDCYTVIHNGTVIPVNCDLTDD